MPDKLWDELTLDEKHNKILQAKEEAPLAVLQAAFAAALAFLPAVTAAPRAPIFLPPPHYFQLPKPWS